MERIVKKEEKRILLEDLAKENVSELLFEDTEGWYITYAVEKLEDALEYCQSTGRGEISGVYTRVLRKGKKLLKFSKDGAKNMQVVKSYKSEPHSLSREYITYYELRKFD